MKANPVLLERSTLVKAVEAVLSTGCRQATAYQSPKLRVTATRRHRPDKRQRTTEIVLTIGGPNYKQTRFVRACQKAGQPFPIQKAQLKYFPAPRKGRK